MFVPDIRTVHAKDLNFILRSEIYVPQPENPPAEPQQPVIEVAALSAEVIQTGGRMVSRKVMTIDRFMPGAQQPNQPPPSQGRSQVPHQYLIIKIHSIKRKGKTEENS